MHIAGHEYKIVTLRGRLFLNREEAAVIVDHDAREFRVSSRIPSRLREVLIAEAAVKTFSEIMGLVAVVS